MISNFEEKTGALFGGLWATLTDEQYRDSVELFTKRAVANNFDLEWLNGKKCLDAGCGSARSSVALAMHGADSIIAVDVSQTGLVEASRRAAEFSQITFKQASVLGLPFEDSTFDFVWCAGVIHHTSDFDVALSELTRVLKPGGKLFLLVYGAGGLRWKAIKALRAIALDLGTAFIDEAILVARFPANNRKHFMDDLFVSVQKLTSFAELATKLPKLGYSEIHRWTGETFDHESNSAAQLEDIVKLERIFHAGLSLAKTVTECYLTQLAHQTATLYVEFARKAMNDGSISAAEIREVVIGEGNHRVVATKA